MESERLLKAQVYGSLNRPSMMLGGERKLVMVSALLCVMLIFLAMQLLTITIGIGLWIFCITALRMMGKADPLMSVIYMRQMHHQKLYSAHSTPFQGAK